MNKDDKTSTEPNRKFWDSTLGIITKITAIITAITGLILAIKPLIPSIIKDNNNVVKVDMLHKPNSANLINYDSIATTLAFQWYNDLKKNNVDDLVEISSIPFDVDSKKILTSLEELRNFYNNITNLVKPNSFPILSELKISRMSELKRKGIDLSLENKFLTRSEIEADPYIGMLSLDGKDIDDGLKLIFRKSGTTLKIAGELD